MPDLVREVYMKIRHNGKIYRFKDLARAGGLSIYESIDGVIKRPNEIDDNKITELLENIQHYRYGFGLSPRKIYRDVIAKAPGQNPSLPIEPKQIMKNCSN